MIKEASALDKPLKPTSTVTRINALLKKAGREERLVRGRGYYYLFGGDSVMFPLASMYVYFLEPTQADFKYAFDWLDEAYKDAFKAGVTKQQIDFKKFL